jgi:hypothetical protein
VASNTLAVGGQAVELPNRVLGVLQALARPRNISRARQ